MDVTKQIVEANHIVTDKEVKAIKDKGLSLVCRPDNLTHINKAKAKRDYVPDEAA